MCIDEIKLLKLGDYVKKCIPQQSDEYFMVTGIGKIFKLRKVGTREEIKVENLEEYVKIDTARNL